MKIFKSYMLLLLLSIAVYFNTYDSMQGLKNVSSVFLWIFTILIFIASFVADDKKRKQDRKKQNKVNVYFVRLWIYSLVFALIYGGSIFIGLIWAVSIIIMRVVNLEKDEEKDEK